MVPASSMLMMTTTTMMVMMVMLMMAGPRAVLARCPQLDGSPFFEGKLQWVYNSSAEVCQVTVSPDPQVSSVPPGEKKSISALGNDCLQFICDSRNGNMGLYLDTSASACQYQGGCSTDSQQGGSSDCLLTYSCQLAEFLVNVSATPDHVQGETTVFAGYDCGTESQALCGEDFCFNKEADPSVEENRCLPKGATRNNSAGGFSVCERIIAYDGVNYTDIVPVTNSTTPSLTEALFLAARSDANPDGGCVDSCAYMGQCVSVGQSVNGYVNSSCVQLTCQTDSTSTPIFDFSVRETACYIGGQCVGSGESGSSADGCRELTCSYDSQTQTYSTMSEVTGCYNLTTNQCVSKVFFHEEDCVRYSCRTRHHGEWHTKYTDHRDDCTPEQTECETDDEEQGCRYDNSCYPEEGEINWTACTKYVCSKDGRFTNPEWTPVPLGCYGPVGCMQPGEAFVDPNTHISYTCPSVLKESGFEYPSVSKG